MELFPIREENKIVSSNTIAKIRHAVSESAFILSKYVDKFETEFAKVLGGKYCLGVNSGTDALMLALKAVGVKAGDEVIVPAFTFISTAFAALYLGAKPVFADIDRETFNLLPSEIIRLANKRTKAVICVHLFGNSCDMDSIMDIAKRYKIAVIEDAAQAHMGLHISNSGKDRFLGTIGDIGAFSFYPTKNLGAWGDAGVVFCRRNNLYKKLKALRDLGRIKFRYRHEELGFNTRLDALQAIVLEEKLKFLPQWTVRRRQIASIYKNAFSGKMLYQKEPPYSVSSYHSFGILPENRDKLQRALEKACVPFAVYYPLGLPDQPVFKGYKSKCPNAGIISKHILNLPIHPFLSNADIQRIIEVVLENA